ncbi:hypothetical protein GJ689_22510 [Rhodoplanes serenus]|uniref:Uncharacterized protein n=1 Tax=Rhodoplanes serenus TaxID=200615 RepID=A0A9X4XSB7_9BRAD|nr:hypothetical protein [Rhodoplanes serenus]MTW18974.1 hypothetical protein [Rhodoplanes serenus]
MPIKKPLEAISVVVVAALVFAVVFTVYALSPVKTSADSRWSLHTSMSLIRGQGGALTAYGPVIESTGFYAIEHCRGEPRTMFPIGVSVLATPAVLVASLVSPEFETRLANHVPETVEKIIASIFSALAAAVFFVLVHMRFPSLAVAGGTTLVFAFGTSMWSVSSRALWQHGPLVLMLVVAMLILQSARTRPTVAPFAALPLAAAFVIRPTAAVPIAVLGLYLLIVHRTMVWRFLLLAALVAVPWLVFNEVTCGSPLPSYYNPGRVGGSSTVADALLGNLVSPSRGLFVYSPVLLLAITGFVVAVRQPADRTLAIAFGAIVIVHWLQVSRFPHWWLGHSYGPRAMSDVLPFLVWFLPFNVAGLAGPHARPRMAGTVLIGTILAGILAAASIGMHAAGALRREPHYWNATPVSVDHAPSRLWDWRDPPFLR